MKIENNQSKQCDLLKQTEEIEQLKADIHKRENEYKTVCKKLQKCEIMVELLKQDADERNQRIQKLRAEWLNENEEKRRGFMGIIDWIFSSKAELKLLKGKNDRLINQLIYLEDQLIEQQKKAKEDSANLEATKSMVKEEADAIKSWASGLFHEKHEMILRTQNDINNLYENISNSNKYLEQLGEHVEVVRNEIYENMDTRVETIQNNIYRNLEDLGDHVEIIRNEIYEYITARQNANGKLFHEKHEMIMKEHQNVLELVRCQILQYYYNRNVNDEVREVIEWLEEHAIRMIPYDFVDTYLNMEVNVNEEGDWYYVVYNGKKIYFPHNFSKNQVKDYFRVLLAEQDEKSPHQYFDESYSVIKGATFIDVGAAEGFIGLSHIEDVKKLILIEADMMWVEALEKTFKPYGDKVQIVYGAASDKHGESEITLDELMADTTEYIVKIDVEGAEMQVLSGINVEKLKEGSKIAVCAYHRQNDEAELGVYFNNNGFTFNHTAGYVFSTWGGYREPFLRRGVLRGEKTISEKMNTVKGV